VLTDVIKSSGRDRLLVSDLHEVIRRFKNIQDMPNDPFEQVLMVIKSIYAKWNDSEATGLRSDMLGVGENIGVAVIVSSMAFGNLSVLSGTGTM